MSTQPVAGTDEERLAQLGYQQELHRKLSGFSNFAVSFSIISILAGAITSYGIAMTAGGPISITLGWVFVGGFNFLGEVAVTAAIDFGAATTTMAFLSLTLDIEVTAPRTFLTFLVII